MLYDLSTTYKRAYSLSPSHCTHAAIAIEVDCNRLHLHLSADQPPHCARIDLVDRMLAERLVEDGGKVARDGEIPAAARRAALDGVARRRDGNKYSAIVRSCRGGSSSSGL